MRVSGRDYLHMILKDTKRNIFNDLDFRGAKDKVFIFGIPEKIPINIPFSDVLYFHVQNTCAAVGLCYEIGANIPISYPPGFEPI